jgi:hypothetical protein
MDAASSVNAQWSNARLSNFSGIDGRMNGRPAPVTAKPIGDEHVEPRLPWLQVPDDGLDGRAMK